MGWLVEEVSHSMEEFKQSLEWLRRLDTLEVLRSEVESQGSKGWWWRRLYNSFEL